MVYFVVSVAQVHLAECGPLVRDLGLRLLHALLRGRGLGGILFSLGLLRTRRALFGSGLRGKN